MKICSLFGHKIKASGTLKKTTEVVGWICISDGAQKIIKKKKS